MDTIPTCHVLAVPYPGRGHINPMMEFCKLLLSTDQSLLITFVVTEEWLGFIGSARKPRNMRFRSIPNVIPSELVRGTDFPSFFEAVHTKMGEPFERLLDGLDHPISCIVADTYLPWAVEIGNQRNIPVVSLFTMSPSVFSILYHYDVIMAHLRSTGNELLDQFVNAGLIVEDWKVGIPLKKEVGEENVVKADEIIKAVQRVMDGDERKELRRKARELQAICKRAIEKGGSSYASLDEFVKKCFSRAKVM